MLFAFTLTTQNLTIVVLSAVCAALLAGLLLRKDTALEKYKKGVMKLVSRLRQLNHIPGGLIDQFCNFFADIVVSDASGLFQSAEKLADKFDEPDAVMRMLREDFKAQFPTILDKPEVGQWIVDEVHRWEAGKAATPAK